LELDAAPFDKQDEMLFNGAGSCANCPKRTGFNKLLFSDVRKDSCTDPQCFRAKIDAHVSKALETKPALVQISSAWNSREGAPLGRNRYVELQIKKARTNGERAKLSAFQKPCDKMTEAIVTDGGKRGHIVIEVKKDSDSAQDLLVKQVSTYDEVELCKLLLEISLLDSAYQRSTANKDDVLMSAAKRYRVDADKLQKAVAGELAAKLAKRRKDKSTVRGKNVA
jgi:hypothetical protein